MKRMLPYPFLVFLLSTFSLAADPFSLTFSTYFGGANDWDQGRDVVMDADGNVYVTGGVTSDDYPTTEGAFQRTFDTSGTAVGNGGYCDAFVTKFDAAGNLVWSTYLGGPNYDRGYGIEIDAHGDVYVCGRAGPGFPVTTGAIQEQFKGVGAGIYGQQNGFVAKLKADGSGLVWSTYVGIASLCRDFAIDADGNVFTHIAYENKGSGTMPAAWFAGRYRETRAGRSDNGVIKVAANGQSVAWATWLGGSDDEQKEASVRVGSDGAPVVLFWTDSTDIATTPGAFSGTLNGARDAYLAKVAADGRSLVWATYFGGPGDGGGTSTHNLAIDAFGNTFYTLGTLEGDLPVTDGAFQTTFGGGTRDAIVAKFDNAGALVASTYLGGSGDGEEIDGIYTDARGNVFVSGRTNSTDFPVTANAHQATHGGAWDMVFALLSADLSTLHYASYFGGPGIDYGRGCYVSPRGDFVVSGSSDGPGFPVRNAVQATFAGGVGSCFEGGCDAGDVAVVKFTVDALDLDRDGLHDDWEWDNFGGYDQRAASDFDGDGVSEFLESALGQDPRKSEDRDRTTVTLDGNDIRLRFKRGRSDLRYVPAFSHDLVRWETTGFTVQANGPGLEAIRSITDAKRGFVRLEVFSE